MLSSCWWRFRLHHYKAWHFSRGMRAFRVCETCDRKQFGTSYAFGSPVQPATREDIRRLEEKITELQSRL
jgi:hypothetical protein